MYRAMHIIAFMVHAGWHADIRTLDDASTWWCTRWRKPKSDILNASLTLPAHKAPGYIHDWLLNTTSCLRLTQQPQQQQICLLQGTLLLATTSHHCSSRTSTKKNTHPPVKHSFNSIHARLTTRWTRPRHKRQAAQTQFADNKDEWQL